MSEIREYKGRIIKGVGGFYYVDTADGCFECRARGSFRSRKITPLVGDEVKISVSNVTQTGAIDEIMPRRNELLRPPVANVTQMAAVVSTANPKPNLYLLDKVLASAEISAVEAIICVNKTDLDSGEELCEIYRGAGYSVIPLSAESGVNIDDLKEMLSGEVTVFAGNSGVGKSSLLNCITGDERFQTGEVSNRVDRGKHTTRHTELVPLEGGGYIIDTPGFGTLDVSALSIENCAELFREFEKYTDECRFSDCSHTAEPDCGVLKAVENGKISKSRYESYVRLLNEIKKKR